MRRDELIVANVVLSLLIAMQQCWSLQTPAHTDSDDDQHLRHVTSALLKSAIPDSGEDEQQQRQQQQQPPPVMFKTFEVGGLCTSMSDGLYHDPLNCDSFVICFAQRLFRTRCGRGTLWNHLRNECDYPANGSFGSYILSSYSLRIKRQQIAQLNLNVCVVFIVLVDCERKPETTTTSTASSPSTSPMSTAKMTSRSAAGTRRTRTIPPTTSTNIGNGDAMINDEESLRSNERFLMDFRASMFMLMSILPMLLIGIFLLALSVIYWRNKFMRRQRVAPTAIGGAASSATAATAFNDGAVKRGGGGIVVGEAANGDERKVACRRGGGGGGDEDESIDSGDDEVAAINAAVCSFHANKWRHVGHPSCCYYKKLAHVTMCEHHMHRVTHTAAVTAGVSHVTATGSSAANDPKSNHKSSKNSSKVRLHVVAQQPSTAKAAATSRDRGEDLGVMVFAGEEASGDSVADSACYQSQIDQMESVSGMVSANVNSGNANVIKSCPTHTAQLAAKDGIICFSHHHKPWIQFNRHQLAESLSSPSVPSTLDTASSSSTSSTSSSTSSIVLHLNPATIEIGGTSGLTGAVAMRNYQS